MASRSRPASNVLPTYTHPHVLVIDEVGDLSYGPDGANVLFQTVNDRRLHSPAHDRSVVDLSDRSRLISLDHGACQYAGGAPSEPSRIPSALKETHGLTDCRTSCYRIVPQVAGAEVLSLQPHCSG